MEEWPAIVNQVIKGAKSIGFTSDSLSIQKVPRNYYESSLEIRRDCLEAPSIDHLCKTLIFENTRQKLLEDQSELLDNRHPKYVVVIIQYTDKMSTKKLNSIMRDELFQCTGIQQASKYFNMRLASEETAIELTGYGNNGISPLGMIKGDSLRIVMSGKIPDLVPGVFFLGAGDIDWKVSLSPRDFVEKTKCLVKDISE